MICDQHVRLTTKNEKGREGSNQLTYQWRFEREIGARESPMIQATGGFGRWAGDVWRERKWGRKCEKVIGRKPLMNEKEVRGR